jgi:nicotinamide-nucleotide amidase
MKAEIIAVGTELLLGQIVNSNARFLSEELNALGIPVYFHSVVGDNPERLEAQLKIAVSRSDLILLTGGLGPTADDITKEVVARHVSRRLVYDQKALEAIKQFFLKRQVEMTENNKRQALVVEGSYVFVNDAGLAPGMAVEHNGKHYLLFPGPPRELQTMFINQARPYLVKLLPQKGIVFSRVMKFCGIGESSLETELKDLIDQQTNPTLAPLAKEGEVTLRLTCHAHSQQEAEALMVELIDEICARVGQYLYGWDTDTLESVLVQRLKEKGLTVATAESCTGGLLSHAISRISGASQVLQGGIVCYTNEIKEQQLGVPREVLDRHGAVSEETARWLALSIRQKFNADLGVSITGVAGPTQQEAKPVGLVYVGLADGDGEKVFPLHLSGQRQVIQERAAKMALYYLIKQVEQYK